MGLEAESETEQRHLFELDLKARWILLAVSALVVYCIVPVRRDMAFDLNAISTWLQALLFMLSFPSGSFFVLAANVLTDGCAECSVAQHFQIWAVALALGYLQWFHLVPALLGWRRAEPPVALNISAGGAAAPEDSSTQTTHVLSEPRPSAPPGAPTVRQFDERGLTPVERIIKGDESAP